MKSFKLSAFLMLMLCLASSIYVTAESGPNYTTRLYPGMDGKLIYVPDEKGNIIPDFSNAGFAGGGVPIPYVLVKENVWGVEGDASPVIQAAIDRVSALEPDENGIRGTILPKMGYYDLYSTLTISASGVVLRGEGQDNLGTILTGRNIESEEKQNIFGQPPLIVVRGGNAERSGDRRFDGSPIWETDDSTVQKITDDYVPVGTRSFNVESVKGYKSGDTLIFHK